jgi:hypothetical protein
MAEYMCLQCGASRIKEKNIQTHLANAHHTGANKILQGQGQVKVKDPMSNRVGWYIARRFEGVVHRGEVTDRNVRRGGLVCYNISYSDGMDRDVLANDVRQLRDEYVEAVRPCFRKLLARARDMRVVRRLHTSVKVQRLRAQIATAKQDSHKRRLRMPGYEGCTERRSQLREKMRSNYQSWKRQRARADDDNERSDPSEGGPTRAVEMISQPWIDTPQPSPASQQYLDVGLDVEESHDWNIQRSVAVQADEDDGSYAPVGDVPTPAVSMVSQQLIDVGEPSPALGVGIDSDRSLNVPMGGLGQLLGDLLTGRSTGCRLGQHAPGEGIGD